MNMDTGETQPLTFVEDNEIECCIIGEKIGPHNPFRCEVNNPCLKCKHIINIHGSANMSAKDLKPLTVVDDSDIVAERINELILIIKQQAIQIEILRISSITICDMVIEHLTDHRKSSETSYTDGELRWSSKE
jgi:hypothetical protein